MDKKNIEIERKFLVKDIPFDLKLFESSFIRQGFLCIDPCLRLRQKDDNYVFTFKGRGYIKRIEFEYPLSFEQFSFLWKKIEGKEIIKRRYFIPLYGDYVAELDIYEGELLGFKNVEVEFPSEEAANEFVPPKWFGKDISFVTEYTNSNLSIFGFPGKK